MTPAIKAKRQVTNSDNIPVYLQYTTNKGLDSTLEFPQTRPVGYFYYLK